MTASQIKILIVDDEEPIRQVLAATLRDEGYVVEVASSGEEGLSLMASYHPEICFLDIWMPGKYDGLEALKHAKGRFPQIDFVMISGHGTIETAVRATKSGAWDFIEKPLSIDKISVVIHNLIAYQQERGEKATLLSKLRRNIAIIGESEAMVSLKQMIARVAPTQSWVLIQGEDGTGKELTAQNLHYLSPRAARTFVDCNCALIPPDLLEAELCGYEKGAFVGADRPKKGRVELADGGTLFVEEITHLTPAMQEKMFRLLQERKLQRVGSSQLIEVDVRVIASTSKDLEAEVQAGRFREDLFDRLFVMPIRIPALRERSRDIPSLVNHFSDMFSREGGYPRKMFSESAMVMMNNYNWPGNVRELKNFIERIYILTPSEFVDVHDLKFAGLMADFGEHSSENELANFRDARAQFEKEYLVKKIAENGGNISKTAEVIGLERSYLHRKIKAYGIDVKENI